ncbi:Cerato-platanin [Fomitopsis betulina]|nr:Cerato-platanin [Fomitopsis betulina]
MLLYPFSTFFALCASAALAQTTVSVSYDQIYDLSTESVDYVACSEDLIAVDETIFDEIPGYPYIGGADVVTGFDASMCQSCWQLTYGNNTVNVYIIDSAGDGFNIALHAMNLLTNNQSEFLGRVNATAVQTVGSVCGRGQDPSNPK